MRKYLIAAILVTVFTAPLSLRSGSISPMSKEMRGV